MRVWKLKNWDGSHISTDGGTFATPAVAVTRTAEHVARLHDAQTYGVMFRLADDSELVFENFSGDSVTLTPDHLVGTEIDPVFDVIQRHSLRWVVARVMLAAFGPEVTQLMEYWANSDAPSGSWPGKN